MGMKYLERFARNETATSSEAERRNEICADLEGQSTPKGEIAS